MSKSLRLLLPVLLAAFAACGGGGGEEKEREVMDREDTFAGPLIAAPDKAADRTSAAIDSHREDMEKRLQEDEGEGGEQE